MKRPIALGLSPNTEEEDVSLACKLLCLPWLYKQGKAVEALEQWFCDFFHVPYAISFTNARSSLYAILLALNIGKNDEVMLQAFTCVVVPNAILALGAKPVYADVNKSLTLDSLDVAKKITPKTKAIIVQHTFGIPTEMEKIMTLAKEHNIYVIEDVAHTIGEEYKKKKLGTFGIASIFSLGRDKAFSSVFGGVAITSDKTLGKKIKQYQRAKEYPSQFWIFQQLFHPVAFSFILPLYNTYGLGKVLLVTLQKLKLLSFPVSSNEKRGKFSPEGVKKLPDALAQLALLQVQKLHQYNQRRKEIAKKYIEHITDLQLDSAYKKPIAFLRFPVFIKHPQTAREFFRTYAIYLGDWYAHVIDPRKTNMTAVGYVRGSCPKAEELAKKVINLPTFPTMTDEEVRLVLDTLKNYVAQ
jgi:perosamine synthetase